MANQVRRTPARFALLRGNVRMRIVDRPAPEDVLRFFVETAGNAKRRGIVDSTLLAARRLKDELVEGYFIVR